MNGAQDRKRFAVWGTALLVLVAGCSVQPRQVRCDGRLEPINPPVLKHFVSEAVPPPAATTQGAAGQPRVEKVDPP